LAGIYQQTQAKSENMDVLCLHDSTEYLFTAHRKSKDGKVTGPGTNSKSSVMLFHGSMVVDLHSFIPLGISCAYPWARSKDALNRHQRNYKKLPIEEKESYRWINNVEESETVLSKAKSVLHVGDRELDIWDFFVRSTKQQYDFLVRANHNRRLVNSKLCLKDWIKNQPIQGSIQIQFGANSKRARINKCINASVKFGNVKLKQASSCSYKMPFIEVWIIEVCQTISCDDDKQIHWYLITNRKVEDIATAKQMINAYKMRWQIEEWFGITKQKGFNFEKSQLSQSEGLLKLLVIILWVSMRHLQLIKQRENQTDKADLYFNKNEIEILKKLELKLDGKTKRQQNPYVRDSLAWAIYILAKLGGWLGQPAGYKPGIKTLKRGEDKLKTLLILYEP